MRLMIIAAVSALAFASAADAKSCKDPKTGKFGACPAAAKTMPMKTANARCKDAKGHFIACSAMGGMSMGAAPAKTSSMAAAKPVTPRTTDAKCKTGVPCGKSCIPKGKVCHKS
jgi:hypothetical protein